MPPIEKMLPQFYQAHLQSQRSKNQYVLLNLLIELLQSQKQVRLERLAANLPLPIQFESRRCQLQRFLISPKLVISSVWFALINYLLTSYYSTSKELIVVVDRTQWRELNILMEKSQTIPSSIRANGCDRSYSSRHSSIEL